MDSLTRKILESLSEHTAITSAMLGQKVNKVEKTVRTRIKELENEIQSHGGRIISKRGVGYLLVIDDRDKYAQWLSESQQSKGVPDNSEERVAYLLTDLLCRNGFVRLDELSQALFISRNTLTSDLKQVEDVIGSYHLEIERRPNYGIRVNGREFDRRLCMANCLVKRSQLHRNHFGQSKELTALAKIIREASHKYCFKLTEVTYDSLIVHTYVANLRIRQNCGFRSSPEKRDMIRARTGQKMMDAAQWIAREIEQQLEIHYDENEVLYLALHISGKASPDSVSSGTNFVIPGDNDEKVSRMLQAVYEEYHLDFRGNLDLRMSLNQHMVPMNIRLRYNIPLKNPILDEIKKGYPFAYTLAATACSALSDIYKRQISEDEIGYIAMLFTLALEKEKKEISRKNIVVVVSVRSSASQLFMYRYRQLFGKYINEIYECGVHELESFPFEEKQIDYVFTSIPLPVHVPVPVFEISTGFDPAEVASFQHMFERSSRPELSGYFSPALFLPSLEADSLEDVIRQMCVHAGQHRELPKNFCDAVLERESAGHTDFGNLVAMPHPNCPITKDTFVTVAVLKKPILWAKNDVQIVLLMSMSNDAAADDSYLIDAVSHFMFSGESVRQLIETPSYETLIRLIKDNK